MLMKNGSELQTGRNTNVHQHPFADGIASRKCASNRKRASFENRSIHPRCHHRHRQHYFSSYRVEPVVSCVAKRVRISRVAGGPVHHPALSPQTALVVKIVALSSTPRVEAKSRQRETPSVAGNTRRQAMMNFCGWLKTFKRKGKRTATDEDEDVDDGVGEMTHGETANGVKEGERSTSEKRANSGRFTGWGRKLKSVTKQATSERSDGQPGDTPTATDGDGIEKKSIGDAVEGNPRNKTALKPGHSLMDWIRLGNSGIDLTGVGGRITPVTHAELAKHNRPDDTWMAIRGKVYNVTRYMNFHPGGADELMRGAGKDATKLFEEVHAWVNYESLLAKCYIGPLRNTVTLNLGDSSKPASKLPPAPPSFLQATKSKVAPVETQQSPAQSTTDRVDTGTEDTTTPPNALTIVSSTSDDSLRLSVPIVPRFDWIQKTAELTLIFYTRSLANPGVLVECIDHLEVTVNILLESSVQHRYRFHLANNVRWPCTARTSLESGKIELMFTKLCPALWTNYGAMTYERRENCELQLHEYDVATRVEITHDSCALLLRPKNNCLLQVTPVGYHVSVSASIEGEYVSRSYTPVPVGCVSTDCPGTFVPLLIKSYPDGCLSKHLTRPVPLGTSLQVSQPSGNFVLGKLRHHNRFALLAAGSGLTPMLALLLYLLERTSNRIEHICLLYFNKTEADIWCREMLENLCKKDKRLTVRHYLSETEQPEQPPADNSGDGNRASFAHGRVTPEIVRQLTAKESPLYATYCCLCGPKPFNELCHQYFRATDHNPKHLHSFQG